MSDFMWFDEVNPVEKAQKTAKAVEAVRTELEDRGIIAFVMNADSLPEAEQRLAMREVNATIDEVVTRHMPEDEGAKARLVSSIFKQFEAAKQVKAAEESHDHWGDQLLCPGYSSNGRITGPHGIPGMRLSRNPDAQCDIHGATGISVQDPNPRISEMAKALSTKITEGKGRGSSVIGERPEYNSSEEKQQHHAELLQQHEQAIRMHRDGGIQEAFPGFEGKVKESAADPSCTRCNGTGTLSDGSHCTCVAPAYDDSGMKNAAKDDDMPMKDGKPAFLDDDDSDDSDDDDSDDDDDDKKKKKKKKKDDDEDDDDEDSEESDDDDSSKKEGSVHLAAGISRSCRLGGHDCQGCECSCHMSEGGPLTDDVDDGLYDPMEFEQ